MQATGTGLAQFLPSPGWGWAGSVKDFLEHKDSHCLSSLQHHHHAAFNEPPSQSQIAAWKDSLVVTRYALEHACGLHTKAHKWGVVFEYELPLEGGRRPDLIVLAGSTVAVVEFKGEVRLPVAYFDQVAAYARDLADYHSACRDRTVVPILAPSGTNA